MNKTICGAAFFLGLVAVGWVAVGYIGSHPLALTMTIAIAAVYGVGALELFRFHQATSSLDLALAAIPEDLPRLGDWLGKIHPSLQNPVRLRIEGERVGLPGPAVTPYLVGLLVLLGMMGTFLGMVVTLNGAVIALESTTDLQTIRAALAAPVKGLGVAFGTSVAGVAASAMLGLISALCRRDRLLASQILDTRIATVLRGFSLVHQRQETFKALQLQSQALPDVADKLQAMMVQMEKHSQALNERLLANQESFYRDAKDLYTDLAASVGQSLQASLTASARLAGETIQPVAEATMAGIARESTALHEKMAQSVQLQLDGLSERFGTAVATVADNWTEALAKHERSSDDLAAGLRQALATLTETFETRSASLLATVGDAHAALQADLAARDRERLAALTDAVESMAAGLQQEWRQAGAQNQAQQEAICRTLEQTAQGIATQAQAQAGKTIDEVARLMQVASEAPRAAAEVVGQLRQELSNSIARDNALLEERSRIMETLEALLEAINHASTEQRGAIDALVASSATLLERAGAQFTERVETEAARMGEVAAQVAVGAVEVASLGEAFGTAVQLFSASNDKLVGNLERIEGSLNKSMTRSNDQLAYYVAQAREIIDLSIMSQKRMVDDLRQLSGKQAALNREVC